jgi:deleted-in-malignant-brain-tumors protein 1
LIDGGDPNAGYLEVCVYNSWGKMCVEHSDATEDDKIGQVICRQLGFDPKVVISNSITSKNHNQLTLLNHMSCAGTERSLFECDYAYGNDCTIKTSFYVYCVTENCTYGSVRLINGKSSDEGKVELCLFSSKRNAYIWATLCDHFWGTFEAQVVCRQLGIPTEIAVAYELPDFSELQLSDHISCTGKESFLLDCSVNEINNSCTYYHDVGVACQTISSSSPAVITIPSVTPIKASEVITDNSLKILIHGFTTVLLTESIETRFKQATVDSCNIFCSSHIDVCIGVTVNKRQYVNNLHAIRTIIWHNE